MNEQLNILLIEDNPGDARLIRESLTTARGAPFRLQVVDRLSKGLERLEAGGVDVLLLDLSLPDSHGLETFTKAHAHAHGVPIIALTGLDDDTLAMSAMREGAQDYLIKGQADGNLLARSIRYAIERKRAEELLRESEGKYRNVVERANDGIVIIQDGTVRFSNTRLAELWGGTVDEVLGTPFTDYIHPDALARVADHYRRRLAGEAISPIYATALRRKDGSKVHAEINAGIISFEGKPADLVIVRDITERKRAEEALAQERLLLRTVIDNLPDAVYAKDRQGRKTLANRADLDNIGRPEAEVLGKTDAELFPPQIAAQFEADDETVLRSGQPVLNREERLVNHEGKQIWQLTSKLPLKDAAGQVVGLVGIGRDITERKQAEEALRALSNRQEALLAAIPDIIMEVDNDKVYTWANQAGLEFFGDDVIGKQADFYFEGEQATYAVVQPLFNGVENTIYVESWQRRKDGQKRLLAWWCRVLKDDRGNPIGALSSARDITERERMEEALREAETKYRTLVEQIPAVVYMDAMDDLSATLYISPQVQAMSGYSPEEWIANPRLWLDLVHPQDRQRVQEENVRTNATGAPYQSEYRLVARDGRVVWVRDEAVVIGDSAGRPRYWQGIMVDITERKRMEEALQDKVIALQTLAEVDREIIAATESQGILGLVCRRAAELVHCPKSAVAIRAASGEMELVASYGLGDPALARREFAQFRQAGMMRSFAHGERAAIVLDDVPADTPYMPELAASENIHTLAIVPLAAGEETLGALVALDTTPREWSADELQALEMLAGQTAVALEKVRLYQAARSRAAYLAMLNEIDLAITSTLDLDRVLLTLLNRVQQVVRAEACSVALVDEATGDLVFRQAVGGVAEAVIGLRLKPEHGIAGWVATHRQSARVAHAASDERFYGHVDRETGFATRDIVCAPLIAHDAVAGVIELLNKQGGTFDEDDVQLLESVAAQAAIAIENARLFEAERQQREFAETLGRVGATLVSTLDAEIVLDRLLEHVSRVIPNDAVNIMLVEGDRLHIVRSRGYDRFGIQDFINALALPLAGLTGVSRVAETGEPVFVSDIHADPNWVHYPELEWQRSYMAAPIRVRGQLVGFLNADSAAPGRYGPAHVERLRAFADQAAIALQNARLYEAQRQQTEDLDAINAVIRVLASNLDLDPLLRDTMRELSRLVAFDRASLALIDESRQVFTMMMLYSTPLYPTPPQDPGQPVLIQGVTMSLADTAAADDVRAGRTHVTDDLSTETAFAGERMLFQAGLRSRVNVPLVHAGQTMGALNLASTRPAAFDRRQVSLLEQIAGPLAIAIENARLFERERVQRQRLETLYRISQVVNLTLDANAILDRLTDEAVSATHATYGSALIARPDLGRFERLSLRGYSPELAEKARASYLPLNRGVNGRAFVTRQAVYLADVETDPDYFPLIPDTRSELAVPLIRGGQVIGNLDLQSPEVDAFRDVDLDFLRALTDQVAVALENARLFDETHRRMQELSIVSYVALIGAAGRPFDETVERATQNLRTLWPNASLGFLFLDEAGESLRPHPSYHGLSPDSGGMRVPLGQGLTGWAARERQSARVGDVASDPRYLVQVPGTRSEMVAPLVVGERVLGVVNVEDPWPDAFSGEDLRLLMTMAGQLATIFEKARLDAEVAAYTATLEQRVAERTAELRQAHEEVSRALEKERELGELKSRFISMASHEFRTPLSSILSSSELIEHYGHRWTDEKKLLHIKRIQAGVRHMVELLDDVLIFGKAEAGKLEFNPAAMDVEAFCGDLMEEAQLQAGAAHELVFVSRGKCVDVTLDEKLLRQILANLLSNAIKYSPQGGVVKLECECLADQVVLRVEDHGIGIPPEARGRLFDTFHRAANVGNIPGTGLGLSIVKKAVDQHGGSITFTSQVDVGTVFTVTLPARPPAQEREEENP